MKKKDWRAINRYNAMKKVYPDFIPDEELFPLIFDATTPEFNKAVTRYKRKWQAQRPKGQRRQKKATPRDYNPRA